MLDLQAVADDKRQFDEAQTDPAAHEHAFRAQVALLKVLHISRNVQMRHHKVNSPAWCHMVENRANLATVHSKVDDALSQVAALSAFIPHPFSLTPRVLESQWQPTGKELLRKCSARNLKGEGGSASAHHEISAPGAKRQLDSSTRVHVSLADKTPTTAQQRNSEKVQRRAQQTDAVYSPQHRADPNNSLEKSAEWIRFNEVAQGVVDCTTELRGKEHLLELLAEDQISELNPSDNCMREYYQLILGGINAVLAIQNVGGNPAYFREAEWIEHAMLPRLLAAIAIMVIHPLCVFGCTLL